jgi:hypothetical protein
MICMYVMMVCITVTIQDIIHHPVLYLKHKVLGTGFRLHLQVADWFASFLKRLSISLVSLFNVSFLKYDWIIAKRYDPVLSFQKGCTEKTNQHEDG